MREHGRACLCFCMARTTSTSACVHASLFLFPGSAPHASLQHSDKRIYADTVHSRSHSTLVAAIVGESRVKFIYKVLLNPQGLSGNALHPGEGHKQNANKSEMKEGNNKTLYGRRRRRRGRGRMREGGNFLHTLISMSSSYVGC